MKIVTAEGEMLERILDGTFEIWNEGLSRSAYGQWNRAQLQKPWARHRLQRFVALDERETILATAKQYRFDVRVGGREGWMCGIGAVFTPPDQRRQGHASTLIEQLMSRAQRDGALLATLFSEIDPTFYERLGFTAVPLDDVTVSVMVIGGAPAMLLRAG
jgi:predicted N-acetyltransferase YhbS